MSTIRTTAHPVILTGSRLAPQRGWGHIGGHSAMLDTARDLYDGDLYGWGMELLYASQVFRLAYDSPRIGGGIDPRIATNVQGLDSARHDSAMVDYLADVLAPLAPDYVQDMTVHAEAVALKCIALAESTGRAY